MHFQEISLPSLNSLSKSDIAGPTPPPLLCNSCQPLPALSSALPEQSGDLWVEGYADGAQGKQKL